MAQKASRYEPAKKRAAPPPNRIVLSANSASWVFWSVAAIIGVMIVAATYWLLTHPLTA